LRSHRGAAARSLPVLQQALVASLAAGLDKGLAHGELVGFATPRRLAVWVKRLAAQQPEQHLNAADRR